MFRKNVILLIVLSFLGAILLSHSLETFSKHNFLPENDLWKQDCLNCKGATTGISEETFNMIVDAAYRLYKPISAANDEELVINPNWEDSTVNASCSRSMGVVQVEMYGGLARREEITAEGFVLVLCHELSHAYGGTPYVRTYSKVSSEGQADYMAAKECAKKIFTKISLPASDNNLTVYIKKACAGNKICLSSLTGGQSLGNLLATIKSEPTPNFETPDQTVVEKINLSYPDTVQCRVDTLHNGALGRDRPLCWFKP